MIDDRDGEPIEVLLVEDDPGDVLLTREALAEFKATVEKLEAGNLPLEESIALFEQGVLLQRRCEKMLSEAELRFQRLVQQAGGKVRALDLSLGESEEPT